MTVRELKRKILIIKGKGTAIAHTHERNWCIKEKWKYIMKMCKERGL